MKRPLIVLTGPTAVGKTDLSIKLAKRIGGEIISADSMQVYKRMDIGSAKVTKEEMDGVSHHLIDILEPTEEFNVAVFKEYADAAIDGIISRGHIPIIAGGTGFYIQAVLNDIAFTEMDADKVYRESLEEIARDKGSEFLHDMLRSVDEKAAGEIHHNNVKRVVRALEFYHETGKKISEHNEEESKKSSPYNFAYFVLTMDRAKLYERIEKRIDLMMEAGLLDEVRALKEMGLHADMVSMKGLGYKEILGYLSGETSLEEAIYILKRDTRRFAKRQLTWFRREKEVIWLEKEAYDFDEEKILEEMLKILKERGIINE